MQKVRVTQGYRSAHNWVMTTRRATRLYALLAAAAVSLTAFVAVSPTATAVPAKKNVTLTVTVLPGQVRLMPGESVKVRLSTNLTTGYSWSTKVTRDKSAVTVSKGSYTAPTTDLVGAPGTTVWTITAKSAGTAVVKFLATPPGGGQPSNDGALTVIVQ